MFNLLFLQYIFILWTFILIIVKLYCISHFIYPYILAHITLNYFYILSHILYWIVIIYFEKPLKKISLYHKECFVLITCNQYADVGLSHVLFWLHPPPNDFILVISPLNKYLWHYYVLNIDDQNSKYTFTLIILLDRIYTKGQRYWISLNLTHMNFKQFHGFIWSFYLF